MRRGGGGGGGGDLHPSKHGGPTHQQHGSNRSPVETDEVDSQENGDPRHVDELVLYHSETQIEKRDGTQQGDAADKGFSLASVSIEEFG